MKVKIEVSSEIESLKRDFSRFGHTNAALHHALDAMIISGGLCNKTIGDRIATYRLFLF